MFRVQVEEGVADVVFESETIPLNEQALQPMADLRTNFAETAFFYPQLRTNEQGEVAFLLYHATESDTLEFPRLFPY